MIKKNKIILNVIKKMNNGIKSIQAAQPDIYSGNIKI